MSDQAADSAALDDIREMLGRFILPMEDDSLDLLTLWAAHTHLIDATRTTPRLVITAAMPGSGKTTVLDWLERLCPNPLSSSAGMTGALLARSLEMGVRTILIDEAEKLFRPGGDVSADLMATVNSGYRKGGSRPVLTLDKDGNHQPKDFPTYAPLAMAGNAPNLPDDTRQRCVEVMLIPDIESKIEDSDWEVIEDDVRALGRRLAIWADTVREDVRGLPHGLPGVITGRMAEVWRPLKRTALVAGGRWPGACDALALDHVAKVKAEADEGLSYERPHVALVKHVHAVWPTNDDQPLPYVATADLIASLKAYKPDVWDRDGWTPDGGQRRPLTAQAMGRMLTSNWKVFTTRSGTNRGYALPQFETAWKVCGLTSPAGSGVARVD